ncbi:MAG: ATP-dependent helicase [Pseudomonadales bacterium]|nr:ATP-dependent helicase [Pseudomonadales bacterium]
MSNHHALAIALSGLNGNLEQYDVVRERGHCVVLAGPGSGKTKTLSISMARTLVEDVTEPRGVACITYNNECAIELESRLAKLGVIRDDRTFIGTIHSFSLTQIIIPYARCIPGLLPDKFRVATKKEKDAAVVAAYKRVFADGVNPHDRWRFATEKRLRDVDRNTPTWRFKNPELATFIEAYEFDLRCKGLIDFDDMPLIAFRMIQEHRWIRNAIEARFPVLFVDEYQDLGHVLHELVLLLCFEGGIRLFAVGDVDQSIYGFTGANPELLQTLTRHPNVRTMRLRFNYRSGANIIRASLGALGEEREYCSVGSSGEGKLNFFPIHGGYEGQAQYLAYTVLPALIRRGFQPGQIAILYRAAWLGDKVAEELDRAGAAYFRTDGKALVKRNSPLARFIESCASWVTGGWQDANPSYNRLLSQACSLVYGRKASEAEIQVISLQLMDFLHSGIGMGEYTNPWLRRITDELIEPWSEISQNVEQEWDVCSDMIERTDPALNRDMPLNVFAGRIEGSGRITMSTLHSAKGREFDAVIIFGINNDDLPNQHDKKSDRALQEARRLFYVGVTRARKELCLVFQKDNYSPWVADLYYRSR